MRENETNRWAARPVLGAGVHGTLLVVPVLLGIVAGVAVRANLPSAGVAGVPRWVAGGLAGTAVVWLAQLVARRFLPLPWLLKMGMLFPGEAPSRFKIARQAGRTRDLEAILARQADGPDEEAAQRNAEVVLTLVAALAAHDKRTRGHAERTRVFTDMITEQIGLPQADRDRLRWAALLHDIGKLEVSARILNKPGKPTAVEWEELRRHPEAGYRMLEPLREWLGEWAETVLHHHERWDGSGYPAGLAGDRISLGARIVAVADAYDVMTSARSYKRPSSTRAAREELVACAGSQFDPAVVRAFLLIPLPRVRWAFGPLAWVGQLPGAREVVHLGATVPAAAGSAAAGIPAAAGAAGVAAGVALAPVSATAALSPPELVEVTGVVVAEEHGAAAGQEVPAASIELDVRDSGVRAATDAVDGRTAAGAAEPGRSADAPGQGGSSPGRSADAPGQGGSSPGRSADAPGQGGSSPGRSADAPGQGGSSPGRSADAPGQGGSSPGRSADAPGQGGSSPGHSGEAPGRDGASPGQGSAPPGRDAVAPGSSGRGAAGPGSGSSGGSDPEDGHAGSTPSAEVTTPGRGPADEIGPGGRTSRGSDD